MCSSALKDFYPCFSIYPGGLLSFLDSEWFPFYTISRSSRSSNTAPLWCIRVVITSRSRMALAYSTMCQGAQYYYTVELVLMTSLRFFGCEWEVRTMIIPGVWRLSAGPGFDTNRQNVQACGLIEGHTPLSLAEKVMGHKFHRKPLSVARCKAIHWIFICPHWCLHDYLTTSDGLWSISSVAHLL